jgi:hypothetical protein
MPGVRRRHLLGALNKTPAPRHISQAKSSRTRCIRTPGTSRTPP